MALFQVNDQFKNNTNGLTIIVTAVTDSYYSLTTMGKDGKRSPALEDQGAETIECFEQYVRRGAFTKQDGQGGDGNPSLASLKVFILNRDIDEIFKKGAIVLEGEENGDEGLEFFQMTIEMETGDCFSMYNIPKDALYTSNEAERAMVKWYFDKLYQIA